MPITIKQNLMKYKSDRLHKYVGINSVAERATADQIEDIEAAGADTIAEVNAAIEAGQAAIDGIESQKNQMIASIAQVAGQGTDETFTQQGVAADAKAVGDLKSAIDIVADQQLKQIYRSNASGTKSVNPGGLSIPAGTYKLSCDGITTNDTDATTSLIVLRNGTTALYNFSVARNTKTEETVTLASACDNIIFYASNTKVHSDGDTFTYHNFLILKDTELNERIADLEDDSADHENRITRNEKVISAILNTQEIVEIAKTNKSGTASVTIDNIYIPAGRVTVSCENVTSSDTNSTVNRVSFKKGDTLLHNFIASRGEASSETFDLTDYCDNIILLASNNLEHSTGDTFTYTGFQVIQETVLNDRITELEKETSDIYDYQDETMFQGDVEGTGSANIIVSLPAGNYILTTDEIETEDTGSIMNRVTFLSGETLKKAIGIYPRGGKVEWHFTLDEAIDNMNFFAAQSSSGSAGKDFEFHNVRIAKDRKLNNRIEKIEEALAIKDNPYDAVDFTDDIRIATTTHDHCREQATLDNMMAKNLGAIAISNYYPSHPCYPMSESGYFTNIPDVIEIPNAEQHGAINAGTGYHFNSVGSMYATGKPRGENPVGTHDSWQRSIEDIKDTLLFKDGGGVTLNHPISSNTPISMLLKALDYDPIVLGIEFFNYTADDLAAGLALWDQILSTGRRCYGFAVPDHAAQREDGAETGINWCGKIVMFVHEATQHECLRAIRRGRFYAQIHHTDLAISSITENNGLVTITTNKSATIKAIANGQVVKQATGTSLTATLGDDYVYLRFEVTTEDDALYTNAIMRTRVGNIS